MQKSWALMSPKKDSYKISLLKMPVIDRTCLVALLSVGALQTAQKVRVADARGRATFVTQSAMVEEAKRFIANCDMLTSQ